MPSEPLLKLKGATWRTEAEPHLPRLFNQFLPLNLFHKPLRALQCREHFPSCLAPSSSPYCKTQTSEGLKNETGITSWCQPEDFRFGIWKVRVAKEKLLQMLVKFLWLGQKKQISQRKCEILIIHAYIHFRDTHVERGILEKIVK